MTSFDNIFRILGITVEMVTRWVNRFFSNWVSTLLFFQLASFWFYKSYFTKDLIFTGLDVVINYIPNMHYNASVISRGIFPLWNHHNYLGVPHWQNIQSGVFMPFQYFAAVYDDPKCYLLTIAFLQGLLGFCTCQWLRRGLGFANLIAFGNGYALMLNGYVLNKLTLLNLYNQLPFIFGALFFISVLMRGSLKARHVAGLTFCCAAIFFSGPPMLVYSAYGLLFYFLFFCIFIAHERNLRQIVKSSCVIASCVLLGLMLALPQIWGTLNLLPFTKRASGLSMEGAAFGSLPMTMVPRIFFPNVGEPNGFGENVVNGAFALVFFAILSCGSMIVTQNKRHRLTMGLGLFFLILGVGLGLGSEWPSIFAFTFDHLPLFNFIRIPARWLILAVIGMALLASVGMQSLWESPKEKGNWQLYMLLCLMAMGVSWFCLQKFAVEKSYVSRLGAYYTLIVVAVFMAKSEWHRRILRAALIVLLICDAQDAARLGIVGLYSRGIPAQSMRPDYSAFINPYLRDRDDFRILTLKSAKMDGKLDDLIARAYGHRAPIDADVAKLLTSLHPNSNHLFGGSVPAGDDGDLGQLSLFSDLWSKVKLDDINTFKLLGIKYVLMDRDKYMSLSTAFPGQMTIASDFGDILLATISDALPRAFWVENRAEFVNMPLSSLVSKKIVAHVQSNGVRLHADISGINKIVITNLDRSPIPAGQIIIAQTPFPGWEVTTSGATLATALGGTLTRIILPQNASFVELKYAPKEFRYGILFSMLAIALLGIYACFSWKFMERDVG